MNCKKWYGEKCVIFTELNEEAHKIMQNNFPDISLLEKRVKREGQKLSLNGINFRVVSADSEGYYIRCADRKYKEKIKMIPWCKSFYKHDFCLEKACELRRSGEYRRVRVGYTIIENGERYSKIYVSVEP